ncbi:GNAT family N-acetyltransferase [Sorangium sp. So ce131]|uniref:GNAT family N-acetyltransferase n=1 Tax=Sorangium sp. So ce131 TaxID=3133282 RepID=UPI003F5D61AC
MSNLSEIDESNVQLLTAWKYFSRDLPARRIEEIDGACLVSSGTQMAMLNIVALSSPARDAGDLERRARQGLERARAAGVPWFMVVSDGWSPGGDPAVTAGVLTKLGFQPVLAMTGMATDALSPPRHEPVGLELRRVSDAETRAAVADINAGCYGTSIPDTRATIGHASNWTDAAFGRVGYLDGQPVCCAGTFLVDGVRYVGFVATAAEHRRKGYGEAVMRRCLDDAEEATGLRRTVLHATDIGRPVYEAMGYRNVTRFVFFAPPQA